MSGRAFDWLLRGGPDGGALVMPTTRQAGAMTVRSVLMVLCDHHDPDTAVTYPSQATIALEAGTDRRTVRHALEALTAAGLITAAGAAVPGLRGTSYGLAIPTVGRYTPPDLTEDSGGIPRQTSIEHTRGSGGGSGGASGGIPRHNPLEPIENPPTPLSEHGVAAADDSAATLTPEDLERIPATMRATIARYAGIPIDAVPEPAGMTDAEREDWQRERAQGMQPVARE